MTEGFPLSPPNPTESISRGSGACGHVGPDSAADDHGSDHDESDCFTDPAGAEIGRIFKSRRNDVLADFKDLSAAELPGRTFRKLPGNCRRSTFRTGTAHTLCKGTGACKISVFKFGGGNAGQHVSASGLYGSGYMRGRKGHPQGICERAGERIIKNRESRRGRTAPFFGTKVCGCAYVLLSIDHSK